MKKEKQEKKVFTVLIVCIVVMALIFGWMSKDLGGSNQYIDKNSKQSLSELMEQMERAYRNRLEITYEQIDSKSSANTRCFFNMLCIQFTADVCPPLWWCDNRRRMPNWA